MSLIKRKHAREQRREAEKQRRKRDLCRCSDDYRFYQSPAEYEEAVKTAEPIKCDLCGKAKLIVAVYPSKPVARPLYTFDSVIDEISRKFIRK